MRLIILTEPEVSEQQVRPLMTNHLKAIEDMIRI
jgi:hypothetical protein